MKQIIGMGNVLVDALYKVDSDSTLAALGLPKGGMTLIDGARFATIATQMADVTAKRTTGGSACNTIQALARLGAPTGLFGKVCDDDNGRFFADSFAALGVRTALLHDAQPTGVASTFITPDGQRTFATHLGAAALLEADDVQPALFDGYSYLYIEGYLVQSHALIERAVDLARAAGLMVCIDLASYNVVEAEHDFFARLLPKTDIVFANEEEARAFTALPAEEALDALARICRVAVVKVGKEGAMARSGADVARVPAGNAPAVVDTTAAGDYFAAGFLYAHARNASLEACLQVGTILANQIIQVVGTKLADDVWAEIKTEVDAVLKA